jgi:hypothetical protein
MQFDKLNIIFIRQLDRAKSLIKILKALLYIELKFHDDVKSRKHSNKVRKLLCEIVFIFYVVFGIIIFYLRLLI